MRNRNVFIAFLVLGTLLGFYLVRLSRSATPPSGTTELDSILK